MEPERPGARAAELPVGTLSFLRSDIEGSMGLARALGARYDDLNAAHHATIRDAIAAHDGQVVRTEGDGVFAVFTEASAAAQTAIGIQRAMAAHDWPEGHDFKVRIGLHAGAARRAGDDYGGFEVARAARIADIGWGGQTILSETARVLLSDDLAADWTVTDLGRHRLKGIVEPERIFQLSAGGLQSDFPPLRTGATATDHLPERLTSVVGREKELEGLAGLLAGTRLLTLTGPGGAGKTTLAVELARRHAAGYADGAWFVDLQSVRDTDAVRSEIAHGLGLLDGSSGPAGERLLAYVADRELLVVIDNFEQVVEAASAVTELVMASPRSRVVVTSRAPLRLTGEQEYPVHPLEVEQDGTEPSEAVRLFTERARRVRPGLRLDTDLDMIQAICEHLDGSPLAIELASASVSSLPIRAIHDRLIRHVPLPGAGARDLPERQRTMEATIAWSYDLLEPSLQRLFARLGVFEGSFELEQVEMACGAELGIDILGGLTTLVEHSLVFHVDDAIGGIRYGMLKTVRSFAAARLAASDEANEVRVRHMRAFAALVDRDWPIFEADEVVRLIDRVEPDEENVRAAAAFAIETGEVEIGLRMVGLLWRAWLVLGRLSEARELAAHALLMEGAEARTKARIMALDAAGGTAYWSGDRPAALACYEEQLEIAVELADPPATAVAAVNLFFTRYFSGDVEGAEQALGLAKRTAEEHDLSAVLARVDLMRTAPLVLGAFRDPVAIRPQLQATTAQFESMADRADGEAAMLRGILSWIDGDLRQASHSWAASIRALLARREVADAALRVMTFPFATLRAGYADIAATVQGAGHAAFERLGIEAPMDLEGYGMGDPTPALVQALGRAGYQSAFDRGRRMSLAEVTDYIDAAAEQLPD